MDITTQSHQVDSFILINFQSWDSSQQVIKLEGDIINNIQGSNESGKSVLFKVLYEMYFPGYHGALDIIRDGCDAGVLFILMTDGTQIVWECHRNLRKFYLQYPGEDIIQWTQNEVPAEITAALGLIVNSDHNIILNVIDKDTPMPFIKSSPKYNAALLKSVVEPDIIKRLYENCQNAIVEIATAKAKFDRAASIAYAKYSALEYVNIYQLQAKQKKIKALLAGVSPMIETYNTLSDLRTVMLNQPKPAVNYCEQADPYITLADKIMDFRGYLSKLRRLEMDKPSKPFVNPEPLQGTVNTLAVIESVNTLLSTYKSMLLQQPAQIEMPTDVSWQITFMDSLLTALLKLKHMRKAALLLEQCSANADTALALYKDAERTLGACPTCGRKFDD